MDNQKFLELDVVFGSFLNNYLLQTGKPVGPSAHENPVAPELQAASKVAEVEPSASSSS